MKKIVFTLMIMLALVFTANVTFAQSTPFVPYEGATHSYTVGGLTDGDGYVFVINQSTVSNATGGATNYTTGTASGTVSGGEATLTVTWDAGSADDGDYYVWIELTDATTSCKNYRYVTVNPVENLLDFTIAAVGVDDNTWSLDLVNDSTNALGEECAVPFGYDYDANTPDDSDNGNTYVYYRIERVNGTIAYGWSFKFTASVGTIERSDAGTSFASYTGGTTVNVEAGDDVEYFRVLVSVSSTTQNVLGSLNADVEATTLLTDSTSPETADIDVLAIPTIGGFSGN